MLLKAFRKAVQHPKGNISGPDSFVNSQSIMTVMHIIVEVNEMLFQEGGTNCVVGTIQHSCPFC